MLHLLHGENTIEMDSPGQGGGGGTLDPSKHDVKVGTFG